MQITRRAFVRGGGLALVSFGLDPLFLARAALAQERTRRPGRVLVCLFQRGAVDGLSMLVPHADPMYYARRLRLAVPRGEVIDLDGSWGLHPALSALEPLWRQGSLAVVPACGSPHATRSHFDAQDYMESGTPGVKSTRSGWLNRYCAHAAAHDATPFRAVAFGSQLPRSLAGSAPGLAVQDLRAFGVGGRGRARDKITRAFEELYQTAATGVVAASADEAFEAVRMLREVNPSQYRAGNGAEYPQGRLGRTLQQIAQLIKADLGLEVAFAESGGWDTHVAQGAAQGQLANRLREFGDALSAFGNDLGERMREVVVLTMSEFGRTVAENGSGGTDHGHGTTMFVFGGDVAGGRVAGTWPGLETDVLFEGRDVAVANDFRDLFGEVLARHQGVHDLGAVFPGHANDPAHRPGVFQA
jgi:uncharacterized protein (DUF1501 family)